jgi:hypothetical protein
MSSKPVMSRSEVAQNNGENGKVLRAHVFSR